MPHGGGTAASRDVLVHLSEEQARRAGHAGLMGECKDGRTAADSLHVSSDGGWLGAKRGEQLLACWRCDLGVKMPSGLD